LRSEEVCAVETQTRAIGTLAFIMVMVSAYSGWPAKAGAESGSGQEVTVDNDSAPPSISGRGTVTLSPAPDAQDGGDSEQRWEVSFRGTRGEGVKGTVRVGGISVPQSGDAGEIDWKLSGSDLSGTVTNPSGGDVVASFSGTVSANGIQGSFAITDGPSGSWVWEGSLPQLLPTPSGETSP
jgi:hypothetical protein